MRRITVSDSTVRSCGLEKGGNTSFRIKIEVAKQLDAAGVDIIEAAPLSEDKADILLVKSIASAVSNAALAVPVDILKADSVKNVWDALKAARKPVLQVCCPVSAVGMEYLAHVKPAAMPGLIKERVAACAALCKEVEFEAEDFTRAEPALLDEAIQAAVEAGAGIITLGDAAGNLLPAEFGKAVAKVRASLPENTKLFVRSSDALFLADASAVEAVKAGADGIKTAVLGNGGASPEHVCRILDANKDALKASCEVNLTGLESTCKSIREMLEAYRSNPRIPGANNTEEQAVALEEDLSIPQKYSLESYLITSGNLTSASCLLKLSVSDGSVLEGICAGNGPVDAAFLAVEKLIGARYELDDFKIRSITEGREALGETIVLLREDGKIFKGRGVSTDIVGSSILAYLDAVNKIAYEEERA